MQDLELPEFHENIILLELVGLRIKKKGEMK